jgi:hypothetical protein
MTAAVFGLHSITSRDTESQSPTVEITRCQTVSTETESSPAESNVVWLINFPQRQTCLAHALWLKNAGIVMPNKRMLYCTLFRQAHWTRSGYCVHTLISPVPTFPLTWFPPAPLRSVDYKTCVLTLSRTCDRTFFAHLRGGAKKIALNSSQRTANVK